MSVTFNEEKKIFRLDTEKSTYVMGVSPEGGRFSGTYLLRGQTFYGGRQLSSSNGRAAVYTIGKQKREISIP